MSPSRNFIDVLCAPFDIKVYQVYAKQREDFDREYYDEQLEGFSNLEWAIQLQENLRSDITYGYVVILESTSRPSENVLRVLATQISYYFPDTGYVAFRLIV